MASLTPSPKMQFFDANGNPLVGGKLYTYSAGTTSPLATYTDSTGTSANTNPIILDSRGEANVWLGVGSYKMILKDSVDALIWTVDNILGAPSSNAALVALAASNGSSLVGFTQSGTGAVATTVQAKLRETVSVKDFGAVGDGVANDTAAIQAACTSAKTVTFESSADNYLVTGTITLSNGTTLLLRGATITQATDQTPIFNANNTDNVTITGGRFVGKSEASYNNTPSSQAICIKADNATDLTVTRNQFENFWYSPLMINSGGNRIEFSNNTVKGPGASVLGVDVNRRNTTGCTIIGSNLRITNNDIYNTAQGVIVGQGSESVVIDGNVIHDIINEHGIYVDTGVRRLTISNNVIRSTGVNGTGLKVQCYDSFGIQPQCVVITGNAISLTGGDAILIDNTTGTPTLKTVGVTITGNTIQNAGAYGIDAREVEDCVISGNEITTAASSGIAWINSNNVLIADNFVRGSSLSGMRDLGPSTNITIKNNIIRNCATSISASDKYGILINNGGVNHVIDGNIISDSGSAMQYGIFVVPDFNSTLSVINNTVMQSTDTALRLGATTAFKEYRRNNWNGTIALTFNDPVLFVVPSASTITLPTAHDAVSISGTTSITSINANGHSGRIITLYFQGILTVVRGSNLILNQALGNFVTTANDTLTLMCDGTNWWEVSRSAN